MALEEDWQADLECWLAPYLEGLGNKTRRRICPAYIAGLIRPGDRKSIQPMAARSDAVPYDRLHHFIGAGLWDQAPLEATLWKQADDLAGGDGPWLMGEHRSNGERKYYLSNLPADMAIKALAGAIKARWICEQAHQQLKEELGLDHFEGRSWTGLRRHALMSMIAYAFLQSRRFAQAGGKKKSPRAATAIQSASSAPGHS
uniref:transposase n=1 Tax=Gluconobacter cerinus TaxID=38307 RepID=UPI0038D0985A